MKMTKRLISLLCIVVLAFSLCGCGNEAKKLYGTWETKLDLTEAIAKQLPADYADFKFDFELTWLIDFNEDGTYRAYADEAAVKAEFDEFINSLVDYVVDMFYEQMAANGLTKEQADEAVQKAYGKSLKEAMLDEIDNSIDMDDLVSDIDDSGVYEVKKGKLYTGDTEVNPAAYETYVIDGDTLTLDVGTGDPALGGEIEGVGYPFIFTKVQ